MTLQQINPVLSFHVTGVILRHSLSFADAQIMLHPASYSIACLHQASNGNKRMQQQALLLQGCKVGHFRTSVKTLPNE